MLDASLSVSFTVSVAISPIFIPFLKKLKLGQFVRDDGPESHLKKQGTPTMGGLIFLLSILVTSVFFIKDYPNIVPILFSTLGFGIVGFLDDFIKVVMKRSLGLTPWQKMLGQFWHCRSSFYRTLSQSRLFKIHNLLIRISITIFL